MVFLLSAHRKERLNRFFTEGFALVRHPECNSVLRTHSGKFLQAYLLSSIIQGTPEMARVRYDPEKTPVSIQQAIKSSKWPEGHYIRDWDFKNFERTLPSAEILLSSQDVGL